MSRHTCEGMDAKHPSVRRMYESPKSRRAGVGGLDHHAIFVMNCGNGETLHPLWPLAN
ncbi:hypothetical protein L4A43_14195 [Salmonella enterica subsp. diarizonae serovar 16:z10:e,n,x,z15]|uniref:hypothetical protein n=1 Tax=Salmonella enterica TaxID=28901 RepID=UPI001F115ADA|nr:hypothetical protein [Salmonella enterica subsp. diarizonae serovar 16:z10:e,n,x,z15]